MTDPGPGRMPRVCRPARSNTIEKCTPARPRTSVDSDFFELPRKPELPELVGSVFAKSSNLPDSIFNYPPHGVITTDDVSKYGEMAILGGRDIDASGTLPLKKISKTALPAGLGTLALRGTAIASVGASCGGLCGATATLAADTGATAAAGMVSGGVVAGALVGFVALLWPSSLGDSSLYTPNQLRTLSQARTRVRLRVEEQDDGALKGYGYYTGKNRSWEMVNVVQFKNRGSQQIADFGDGVELIWTPAVDSNTILGIPALESAPNTPQIWIFPPTEAADSIIVNPLYPPEYRDFILVFPADSGLRPLYIVLSVRNEPGVVTGRGQDLPGSWLAGASHELGSPLPTRIVDQLRGKNFSSFDAFRKEFWITVSNDPELRQQFNPRNLSGMEKGLAPAAPKSQHAGKRIAFEIHHVELIKDGGAVYDANNLRIVTPARHIDIHKGIK